MGKERGLDLVLPGKLLPSDLAQAPQPTMSRHKVALAPRDLRTLSSQTQSCKIEAFISFYYHHYTHF